MLRSIPFGLWLMLASVLSTFLYGQLTRYEAGAVGNANLTYVLDRMGGHLQVCTPDECFSPTHYDSVSSRQKAIEAELEAEILRK